MRDSNSSKYNTSKQTSAMIDMKDWRIGYNLQNLNSRNDGEFYPIPENSRLEFYQTYKDDIENMKQIKKVVKKEGIKF